VTERQGAEPGSDTPDDASWRVDGAKSSPTAAENGLGDTVVQIPKITDETKPAMGRGRASSARTWKSATASKTAEAKTAEAEAAASAAKPSIPKPVKTRTDDLMAPFDQPKSAKSPAAVAAPKAPAKPVPSMAMPTPPASATVPAASVAAKPAAPAAKAAANAPRRTRKARLRLSRIDPWSVMKTVFLFSIAFGVMSWVATYLLWQVLLSSGLFSAINDAVVTIISSPNNTEGWRIEDYLSANKVLGVTALLSVINVVISTALGTLGAFLYNLSANILGGLELTLAED
jgi:hypothetical protein